MKYLLVLTATVFGGFLMPGLGRAAAEEDSSCCCCCDASMTLEYDTSSTPSDSAADRSESAASVLRDVIVLPNKRTQITVWVNAQNYHRAVIDYSDGAPLLDVQGHGTGADYKIGYKETRPTSNQHRIRVRMYYQRDGVGPWIELNPYIFQEDQFSVTLATREPNSPDEDLKVKIEQLDN